MKYLLNSFRLPLRLEKPSGNYFCYPKVKSVKVTLLNITRIDESTLMYSYILFEEHLYHQKSPNKDNYVPQDK